MKRGFLIATYLLAFVIANLIVKHYGAKGLWISSFVLIPFDFVCRCVFHETWKGRTLIRYLTLLTLASGALTVLINWDAINIAGASFCGFAFAQATAGIFYQSNKQKSWFYKVNVSDIIAIISDSIIFQLVAFGELNPVVTLGQAIIKMVGGLLWYFVLFRLFKIHDNL